MGDCWGHGTATNQERDVTQHRRAEQKKTNFGAKPNTTDICPDGKPRAKHNNRQWGCTEVMFHSAPPPPHPPEPHTARHMPPKRTKRVKLETSIGKPAPPLMIQKKYNSGMPAAKLNNHTMGLCTMEKQKEPRERGQRAGWSIWMHAWRTGQDTECAIDMDKAAGHVGTSVQRWRWRV